MRQTRVFVDSDLYLGAEFRLPEAQARHVAQVLRQGEGDSLLVFNGDGHDYSARLTASDRQGVRLSIEDRTEVEPQPPLLIHLALGISRGERMDFALQKAVELGVERLTPVFTERSQVRLDGDRLAKRMEHWRGVVISACEQSGRRRLPVLAPAEPLETWLAGAPETGLLLDPAAESALATMPKPPGEVTLLVGPEGGLSPREGASARGRGFRGARLGPRILRTETAPLAAIAVIQALWGDFRDA